MSLNLINSTKTSLKLASGLSRRTFVNWANVSQGKSSRIVVFLSILIVNSYHLIYSYNILLIIYGSFYLILFDQFYICTFPINIITLFIMDFCYIYG